jgi:CelD/BcsL family acetyltransferase involved in cellulose biosynthesis
VHGGKYYAGLLAHDPRFHKHSVGTALIARTIQSCIAHGWTELDMTRGDEPYKAQWNARPTRNYRITLHRSRATLAATAVIESLYRRANASRGLKRLQAWSRRLRHRRSLVDVS